VIIDFRVFYDQSTGTWVELASGVLTRSYVTKVELTQGLIYGFRV